MIESFYFYATPFIAAFVVSFLLTPLMKALAVKWGAVDVQSEPRHVHPQGSRIPRLGGWSVIVSFLVVGAIFWTLGYITDSKIHDMQIGALLISALLIMGIGFLDDRYNLKPWQLFIVPVAVSLIVVTFGVKVGFVTNPFEAGAGPYGRSLVYLSSSIGAVFSFLWILGMMYTVKLLDGLDGLVTGIGSIGAIILFIVSLFWDVPLSGTSILAIILAGSLLGFLPYNWHPAKIFLGESSLFVGFMLGVLSIISGAKIATALLVMGIPVLDVVWVIVRRLFLHKSPFRGDRTHLHFQLLDSGLSHRQTVLLLYALTAAFGTISIFLQSTQKVIALGVLVLVMTLIILLIVGKKKNTELTLGE